MAHNDPPKLAPPIAGALMRPHYEVGNYLATEDLQAEQDYRRQRLRRHNRYLHGWGRVCGLRVVPARDATRPWGVMVCPGYGITCCGDEIEVCCPSPLDIRDYLWSRPTVGGIPVSIAYVGIRFVEEMRRPVEAQKLTCKCEGVIHPSRLADSFQIDVLWSAVAGGDVSFDICAGKSVPCPKCGDDPYIILASVDLPKSEGQAITLDRIDNLPYIF